eukprot:304035-Amphidinium_carterae.1
MMIRCTANVVLFVNLHPDMGAAVSVYIAKAHALTLAAAPDVPDARDKRKKSSSALRLVKALLENPKPPPIVSKPAFHDTPHTRAAILPLEVEKLNLPLVMPACLEQSRHRKKVASCTQTGGSSGAGSGA